MNAKAYMPGTLMWPIDLVPKMNGLLTYKEWIVYDLAEPQVWMMLIPTTIDEKKEKKATR